MERLNKFNNVYKFDVCYGTRECDFTISVNHTVEDVKLQIYEKFKIKPSHQIIKGWPNEPKSDNQTLVSFLPLHQQRYQYALWVTSNNNEQEMVVGNGASEVEANMKMSDIEAATSFMLNFNNKYGSNHCPFRICFLSEALKEACFAPIPLRKIVAIYLHNENDPFSQMLCPCLVSGDIRNILEENYYFIGWNIGNELYHDSLKESLLENIDFEVAQSLITDKCSALLIVYPIENSVAVFSMLHGKKVNAKDVLMALEQTAKNFALETAEELELENIKKQVQSENDIGAEEFQQMICDRLGDRDYDCFEYDEGEHLKNKIGFAKFGHPLSEEGYDTKQKKRIDETFKKIVSHNNKFSEWKNQVIVSFIYNCLEPMPNEKIKRAKKFTDYNPETDILPIPIFVIRKCIGSSNPCRIFIDNANRVYESWKDYIEDNKLHQCTMILPKDCRYMGDDNEVVILEKHLSPACGIGRAVLNGVDIGATVVGLASGGIFVAAMIPAIVVAPVALTVAGVTGIGLGVYSIVRSALNIHDRRIHDESMSFANSEARGAYINIVAGSLGFVGAGATTVVSQLAGRGLNLGQGARIAFNTIGALNVSASGAGIANSSYQIYEDWRKYQTTPSLLVVVQLSSSILFFGNAVYNFKTAGTIIEESQAQTLKLYQESLRSNRHRKMFNKMVKETVRQNSGDTHAARSEVIKAIRNIGNKDEIFATLTRNNKLFNEKGIRFSAEDGQIKLNGMSVDLFEFNAMPKANKIQFVIDLPISQQPSVVQSEINIMETMKTIENVLGGLIKYGQLISNGCSFTRLVANILFDFSTEIQEKMLHIFNALLSKLFSCTQISFEYFSKRKEDGFTVAFKLLIDFLKIKMNEQECKYSQSGKQAVALFEHCVNSFFNGSIIVESLLRELIKYVVNCLTQKLYDYCDSEEKRKKREANCIKKPYKIPCKICGGYYFSVNEIKS